jgi:hypothetical protein
MVNQSFNTCSSNIFLTKKLNDGRFYNSSVPGCADSVLKGPVTSSLSERPLKLSDIGSDSKDQFPSHAFRCDVLCRLTDFVLDRRMSSSVI